MLKKEIEEAIQAQTVEADAQLGMLREALSDLPVERNFATIVTGVRRCGKSTLLVQWAKRTRLRVVRVLFDDLRLMDFTTDDFALLGKIFAERRAQAVVLDEVQDVPGWERFVAGLLPTGMIVLVTGSNAKMLSKEMMTTLGGRYLPIEVYPYSFMEYLQARQIPFDDNTMQSTSGKANVLREYSEYMKWGGLPFLYTLPLKFK